MATAKRSSTLPAQSSRTSAPRTTPTSNIGSTRRLPRGASSLPREVVLATQTHRLVEGTAHAVDERGYAATTVADIIERAGVSRATFYQLFKDKEDCFLFCFKRASEAHLEVVLSALHAEGAPPDRLIAALAAYVGRIDADRAFARAFIAEAEGASPAVVRAFQAARDRLGEELGKWFDTVRAIHPDVPSVSKEALELVQAGLVGFVIGRVRVNAGPLQPEVMRLATFIFAGLGLYEWARFAQVNDGHPPVPI